MTATKIHTLTQGFNARTFVRDLRNDPDLQGNISDYLAACLQAMIAQELKTTDNAVTRYKTAYETVKLTLTTARKTAPEFFLDGELPDPVAYALCAISQGYSAHTPPPGPGAMPITDTMPTHPLGHDPVDEAMQRFESHEFSVLRLFNAIKSLDNQADIIINNSVKNNFKRNMTTDAMSQNADDMLVIMFDINHRLKQGIEQAKKSPTSFYGQNTTAYTKDIIKAMGLAIACRWPDRTLAYENTKLATRLDALLDIQRKPALTNA